MDFWISDWISGFQSGFLPTVYEISFVADLWNAVCNKNPKLTRQRVSLHVDGILQLDLNLKNIPRVHVGQV